MIEIIALLSKDTLQLMFLKNTLKWSLRRHKLRHQKINISLGIKNSVALCEAAIRNTSASVTPRVLGIIYIEQIYNIYILYI